MSGFFKRLFGTKYQNADVFGDFSSGNWEPVPISATAQMGNVMGWLEEPDPVSPSSGVDSTPRARRSTIRRMFMKLKGTPEYLTDEELEIVEKQRTSVEAPPAAAPAMATPTPAAAAWGETPQCLSVPEPAAQAPTDDAWVDVLKTCGEHLTDEELAIIRKQMD